jgi:hypothetical protein
VPVAAPRVAVHGVDELRECAHAVADHVGGRSARRGDETSVDDEQPVVVSGHPRLDQHLRPHCGRLAERLAHGRVALGTDRDATAVVRIEGLDDDRAADLSRGLHGLVLVRRHSLLRHRQTGFAKELVREALVPRDVRRERGRAPGQGSAQAALPAAGPEPHERAGPQRGPRDPAGLRRADDALGRRAVAMRTRARTEPGDLASLRVGRPVAAHDGLGALGGEEPHLGDAALEQHLAAASVASWRHAREPHVVAELSLERERAAGQREARRFVGRLHDEVHDGDEHVPVRTTMSATRQDAHGGGDGPCKSLASSDRKMP